jgi:hypothetical protein
MLMLRLEKRNPAARELLEGKGAGGAENVHRQADEDHEDTLPIHFDQSFLTRCEMVQAYARRQYGSVGALPLPSAGGLP